MAESHQALTPHAYFPVTAIFECADWFFSPSYSLPLYLPLYVPLYLPLATSRAPPALQSTAGAAASESDRERDRERDRVASLKGGFVKGQWTKEEDELLNKYVELYGTKQWARIALVLPVFSQKRKKMRARSALPALWVIHAYASM